MELLFLFVYFFYMYVMLFFRVKSVFPVAKVRVFFCKGDIIIRYHSYLFDSFILSTTRVLKLTRFLTDLAADVFPVQNQLVIGISPKNPFFVIYH